VHRRSGVFLFALLVASFGFVGCSGLVAGNNGNPPPPSTLVISNVQSGSVTTTTSQVVWTTNVPADSSVDYGTTTAYGNSTPVDSAMVTSHQMTLSGLAAGTTYYYQVNSTDSKGNHGHGGSKFNTAGFNLSGTINPATGGSGATVTLSGAASATTTANSSGAYTFTGLASGSYTITPSNTGYTFTPASQNVTVSTVNVTGVNFTANAAPVAPTITTQPASQTVTAGQTASFSMAATGTAPLSYQWNRNGTAIFGATSSSYTTAATTSSDNGAQFTVLVSNTAGSVTSNAASLTVSAAPVAPSITTQPASQTVSTGQTASFSVAATGTVPLSYQWQKNGANIVGATSASYTTAATTTADSGSTLRVVVSNTAGTVTSAAATLTVNPAPSPGIQVSPTSINFGNAVVGSTSSQPLIIANTGTATLSITQVTETGSAFFNVSGFSLPLNLSVGQQATITVAFLPTSVGAASGNISIVSNAPGSPLAISLSGTGLTQTFLLGANPTSLSFGNVNLGSTSSLATTLTNSGNSSVTISSVTATGTGFSTSGITSGTILAPNQSATLTVAFAPTVAQNFTGSVTVASNATNSPAAVTFAGVGLPPTTAPFPVWVQSGLLRVGQTDAPGTASSISFSGARGETVDTQVIVSAPAGGLTNVNLSASALAGPSGATISASNFVFYREYYVTVQGSYNVGGSNQPLGAGTYPEPLIPFVDPETGAALSGSLRAVPATVAASQNQPFWIDLNIPRGKTIYPPGAYTGTITVTSSQGNVTVPMTLTLWDFQLPLQPSELTHFIISVNSGNPSNAQQLALTRNRIFSMNWSAAQAASFQASDGLNRSSLGETFGWNFVNCNGSLINPIPSQSAIAAAAVTYPAGMPLDLYASDECIGSSAVYPNIKLLANNAHAAGVKILDTVPPDTNLYNYVDYWVMLTVNWPASLAGIPGSFWSYASCNVGNGSNPRWDIDFAPINERLQAGFLNQTQGATGLLYYTVDGWSSGNAIGSYQNLNTSACGVPGSADGMFIYPPGPIASSESAPGIRLKAVRDGIQDFEYVQILKNLGQAAFVNPIIQPIAASWSNWSHNPNALEGARLQLGQQLHQLAP